jgi:protein-disulfide isomerase
MLRAIAVVAFGIVAILLPAGEPAHAQTPATPSRDPGILAEVDGTPVTSDELASSLGAALNQLEQQMYAMRQQRLEALIAERLVAKEAAKRGVSPQALLDQEVTAKVGLVTETEIEGFYEANKGQINAPLAAIRDRIRTYLQNQKVAAQQRAFVQTLRSGAKVVVYLKPPTPFRASVSVDDSPVQGAATAPVTIVEFSDFYCPYCRQVLPVLAQVRARYGDKVRLVFKNLPLENLHPGATKAAEAAQCAKEQGKFWEYHDKLFAEEPATTPDKLKTWAGELGLDAGRFEQCLASGKQQASVQRDVNQAIGLGANFTPAFFVNGLMLSGAQPLEAFVRLIDAELKQPR